MPQAEKPVLSAVPGSGANRPTPGRQRPSEWGDSLQHPGCMVAEPALDLRLTTRFLGLISAISDFFRNATQFWHAACICFLGSGRAFRPSLPPNSVCRKKEFAHEYLVRFGFLRRWIALGSHAGRPPALRPPDRCVPVDRFLGLNSKSIPGAERLAVVCWLQGPWESGVRRFAAS